MANETQNFFDFSPSNFQPDAGLGSYFAPNSVAGMTVSQPNPAEGPLLANAPPDTFAQKWLGAGPQGTKIFGMEPQTFIQLMGQAAGAIAPGSIGANLGAIASSMGKAQMMANAAKEQDRINKEWLKKVLSPHGGSMAAAMADPQFDVNKITNAPYFSLLAMMTPEGIASKTPEDLLNALSNPKPNKSVFGGGA